ncbi:transposase [Streptomyces kaniharaensis]|uniref:transposase n=1 Tax=Streptomyces kaniharaensis TaxID=212423 RepID=UPI00389AF316
MGGPSAHARCVGFIHTGPSHRSVTGARVTDAILCADGPVKTLVEFCLAIEPRRGHGALYAALDRGWLEPARVRRALASLPLPKAADGRVVLAVDVSNWALGPALARQESETRCPRVRCPGAAPSRGTRGPSGALRG